MGRAIFISYRRDDTEGEAGRLYDDLVRTYGEASVFMDVAGINPGLDFRKAIDDNVATCGVLLAMIGPMWGTVTNASGGRRLEDENDFVRLEIASALRREIPVIPVLVHDAKMPRPEQLPEDLKNLAYRNSVEITHARWNSDVQLLTKALAQYVAASGATNTEPVHATVAVQLPAPHTAKRADAPAATKSKAPLLAGIGAVVVLALAAAVYAVAHHGHGTPAPVPEPGPAPVRATTGAVAGIWTNPSAAEKNGIQKLEITAQGNVLTLHAWGQCVPADCDWGTQTATFDGQKATASWSFPEDPKTRSEGRMAAVTIMPQGAGLHVTVVNSYATRKPNEHQFDFVRAQ